MGLLSLLLGWAFEWSLSWNGSITFSVWCTELFLSITTFFYEKEIFTASFCPIDIEYGDESRERVRDDALETIVAFVTS